MKEKSERELLIEAIRNKYGRDVTEVTREQLLELKSDGHKWPIWLINDKSLQTDRRGVYYLPRDVKSKKLLPIIDERGINMADAPAEISVKNEALANTDSAVIANEGISLVPITMPGYVPFGNYSDLEKIIKSGLFYPTFITGLSGNGKTLMIKEVCANLGREMLRVNITIETDEDDLIGGFRLVDGNTVWQDGPVIVAMQRGAVLLLDEIDLASNKIMCLQPILEGESVYIKKANKVIRPSPGFNIVCTANTKGQGSVDGRFIGANVLNEAFLERFAITLEQEYPESSVEYDILLQHYKKNTNEDANPAAQGFMLQLVDWAEKIRDAFEVDSFTDVISTRRLVHIVSAYSIFGERNAAIDYCLARFDEETKMSFRDMWNMLTPTPEKEDDEEEPVKAEEESDSLDDFENTRKNLFG